MRAILLLLTTLVFVIGIFSAGVALTAYVIAEPEPHRFAHLDTPDLWTSRPVAIDPAKQHYERIEAIPAIASLPAVSSQDRDLAANTETMDDQTVDGMQTSGVPAQEQQKLASADPAHREWCFERYRSYRAEDNSYQPYGSATRQQCESPWTPMAQDMQAAAGNGYSLNPPSETVEARSYGASLEGSDSQRPTEHADVAAPIGAHEEWCHARYRSYRVGDNSYQPYDGGPRRTCSSPYG